MDLRYPQLIDLAVNEDVRGRHVKFFGEGPEKIVVPEFEIAEVFMTHNNKNTVRGIHYQNPGQSKVIQVVQGSIIGNILCCNPELAEFGTAVHFSLSAESESKMFIPRDWAQGYRALEADTKVLYLADSPHNPEAVTIGVDPFDLDLKLDWGNIVTTRPAAFTGELVETKRLFTRGDAIVSERDKKLNNFEDFKNLLTANEDKAS